MARPDRLRTAADFDRVKAARSAIRGQALIVGTAPGTHGHARLGMAVGKRQAGSAVQRNRIRRRLAATFRQHAARLPAIDVVVVVRMPCRDLPAARAAALEFATILDQLSAPAK